jgi:hypothetical protein
MYFRKGNGNDLLLPRTNVTLNDGSTFEIAANEVRIVWILYSTDDDNLVCCLEDVATGKDVTVPVTEKDENGNEQLVEQILNLQWNRTHPSCFIERE